MKLFDDIVIKHGRYKSEFLCGERDAVILAHEARKTGIAVLSRLFEFIPVVSESEEFLQKQDVLSNIDDLESVIVFYLFIKARALRAGFDSIKFDH